MNNVLNVLNILTERGFIQQVTDVEAVRKLFAEPGAACYIGFDPTADSLHAGSLLQIMALVHLQRSGCRPIALIGGGTAMVGDPSGRTELRQMLSAEAIRQNAGKLRSQLGRYLDFEGGRALSVDNADWLLDLKYVDFLREIGRHFSVNRMLSAEAYKIRMEAGLSFIEFNYQLLQAYDFLTLYRLHNCRLQMGGDDQWGNILAGVDLIRRVEGATVEAATTPLLTTATGAKMGKTAEGAVWLDPDKLSPYGFYQYWINVDDRDVERFLAIYTLLPMEEVRLLGCLQGADIRQAKEVLAYEATAITHGEEKARRARDAARTLFRGAGGPRSIPLKNTVDGRSEAHAGEAAQSDDSPSRPSASRDPAPGDSAGATPGSGTPTTTISRERLDAGLKLVDILVETGLAASRGEARRLIQQGGACAGGQAATTIEALITTQDVPPEGLLLRAGKKRFHVLLVD